MPPRFNAFISWRNEADQHKRRIYNSLTSITILHKVGTMPQELESYVGSYIYSNQEHLYYIDTDETAKPITLRDIKQFKQKLGEYEQQQPELWYLDDEQFNSLITVNGGHISANTLLAGPVLEAQIGDGHVQNQALILKDKSLSGQALIEALDRASSLDMALLEASLNAVIECFGDLNINVQRALVAQIISSDACKKQHLALITLLDVASLKKVRPYVIVVAFIIGMLLTPPDVLSQIMLAIPLCLLYELGIILAIITTTNKAQAFSKSTDT